MPLHELLPNLEIDILASDFHKLDNWWNFKNVSNHFSRLYYITKGNASVFHHGKRYKLKPNTVHLIPCFSFCNMNCGKQFEQYNISFTSRIEGDIDLFNAISCEYQYEGNEQTLYMFKRLMELNKNSTLTNMNPYQQLKSKSEREEHIATKHSYSIADIIESTGLMRLLIAPFLRTIKEIPKKEHKENKRLNKILLFIENNVDKAISLQSLAKNTNIHPTYLSDFFVKNTGIRPVQYINQKKIDKAKMLLNYTEMSIKEIGANLGFSSIQYFSKTFKQFTEISPKQFRLQRYI